MIRFLIPALLILAILIGSCDISSPQSADQQEIRDLFYQIGKAFNWADITAIMEHIHPDFRHQGMYKWQIRNVWLDRMARYSLMETNITHIEINGDFATVHFDLTFTSATENVSYLEPDDNGDLSYLYYDNGRWQVWGDQVRCGLGRM